MNVGQNTKSVSAEGFRVFQSTTKVDVVGSTIDHVSKSSSLGEALLD